MILYWVSGRVGLNRFAWQDVNSNLDSRLENDARQPRPQGLLLVQNGDRRNPWPRLLKWLQKCFRIWSRKHDEMISSRLNLGFRLQKTNRAVRRWKQPPKKPFHHVSRYKILHDSWSISAALARGFSDSDRHFVRGEGPGDEVATKQRVWKLTTTRVRLITMVIADKTHFSTDNPVGLSLY